MSKANGCPNPDCDDPNCQLAHGNAGEGLSALLDKLLNITKPKTKRAHVDYLTADEIKAFNTHTVMKEEITLQIQKFDALRKKFWTDIELRLNHFDGDLHIDIDTTSIYKEVSDDDKK